MARKTEISRKLQRRAEQMIPGGVNSPVRAFRSVGGDAPFIVRGEGSHIIDADGNEYIDYIGSWGPLILGHAAPAVVEAEPVTLKEPELTTAEIRATKPLPEVVSYAPAVVGKLVDSATPVT